MDLLLGRLDSQVLPRFAHLKWRMSICSREGRDVASSISARLGLVLRLVAGVGMGGAVGP